MNIIAPLMSAEYSEVYMCEVYMLGTRPFVCVPCWHPSGALIHICFLTKDLGIGISQLTLKSKRRVQNNRPPHTSLTRDLTPLGLGWAWALGSHAKGPKCQKVR